MYKAMREAQRNKRANAKHGIEIVSKIDTLCARVTICEYYDWRLFAAHVRSNHVHILLRAINYLSHKKVYKSSALEC